MAGNPRKMLKRFEDIEQRASGVCSDLNDLMPEVYRERPNDRDPLGQSWAAAYDAVTNLSDVLDTLGDLLRAKAGVPDPDVDWDGAKAPESAAEAPTGP